MVHWGEPSPYHRSSFRIDLMTASRMVSPSNISSISISLLDGRCMWNAERYDFWGLLGRDNSFSGCKWLIVKGASASIRMI